MMGVFFFLLLNRLTYIHSRLRGKKPYAIPCGGGPKAATTEGPHTVRSRVCDNTAATGEARPYCKIPRVFRHSPPPPFTTPHLHPHPHPHHRYAFLSNSSFYIHVMLGQPPTHISGHPTPSRPLGRTVMGANAGLGSSKSNPGISSGTRADDEASPREKLHLRRLHLQLVTQVRHIPESSQLPIMFGASSS